MHIHVDTANGEAKFWLEPGIELASQHNMTGRDLARIRTLIEERHDDIRAAWFEHFGR